MTRCASSFKFQDSDGHSTKIENVYGMPIPRLGDGCTNDRALSALPHWHCPYCGAVANLHKFGQVCLGCDLCREPTERDRYAGRDHSIRTGEGSPGVVAE